ncbi:MAG: alpha/beta fold hydrolase [Ilumatobacter sp.]
MIRTIAALVHGNPETEVIWNPLVTQLAARDVEVVRLSPPGFGSPLPDDFEPTATGYLNWLVVELETIQKSNDVNVDIVGHDWGAGHVFRLASQRPDLVRSWAADIGGLLHPHYRWHDAAQAWQTPEVGEQVIDAMVTMALDDRIAAYADLGLPADICADMAAAMDAEMGRAILTLYRSAPESELRRLADRLEAADHGPGLIITADSDPYVAAELAGPVAQRLGVDELVLEGQGHWWMVSDPVGAADGLVRFWSSL